jgi:copper(I)-binding protein
MSTMTRKMAAMHPSLRGLIVGLFTLAAIPALAEDYVLKELRIEHPSARATPPGARSGGAYFTVRNGGGVADRLVRVASPVAAAVELHSMTMDGNMMRMRQVAGIDIAAGATLTLASGGYHVMLIDLRQPLKIGDKIPLTLNFDKSGAIDIVATVEAAAGAAAPAGAAGHGH